MNQSKGILPKGTTLAENGTATNLNKQSSAKNLPQTGENESKLGLIGLSLATLTGLISLVIDRRKHKN